MASGKFSNQNWRPLVVRDNFMFVRGNVAGFETEGSETGVNAFTGFNNNPGSFADVPSVIAIASGFGKSTQPGNIRLIDSEVLLNFAGTTSLTSGQSIVGIRGAINLAAGTTIAGSSYLYGVQGKYIAQGVLNNGSAFNAGLFGQVDTSNAGFAHTSGYFAPVIADMGATSHLTLDPLADIFVGLNTTTSLINSLMKWEAKANYFMDISDLGQGAYIVSGTGVPSSPAGAPALGFAANYAILAGSTITSATTVTVTGNVGLAPGSAITGVFVVSGTTDVDNAAATNAQTSLAGAIAAQIALVGSATSISATLAGQTLAPGSYTESSSTFTLSSGTLTLNAPGVYIFICASTLTVGAGGTMAFSGGATPANTAIYWVVQSSATLNFGAGLFYGNVMAHTSITVTSGSVLAGRLLANIGAVTFAATSAVNSTGSASSVTNPGTVYSGKSLKVLVDGVVLYIPLNLGF